MTTAIEIAAPVVLLGWFFIAFAQTFCTAETVEEEL